MELNILLCAVVIIMCILSSRFTDKYGIPSVLLFILIGMIFGSEGIFKIPFEDYEAAEKICTTALIFIMFYGGFGTSWRMAKPVLPQALLMSTAGVVMTAGITGIFCHLVLRMPWMESLLLGSVVSSTDAASVFSILRSKKLNLKYGTASILEVESGSNDPFSYMLTMIMLEIMKGDGGANLPLMVASQLFFGVLCGVLIGKLAIYIMKNVEFAVEGLDTIMMVAMVLLSYVLPVLLGGNGFLSAYLVGILVGNQRFQEKIRLIHFFDGVDQLAQMLIFFLLGLLVYPSRLVPMLLPAIVIFVGLTFLARPLTTFILLTPLRASLRQQALISLAGFRGAASIVFAIVVTVSPVYTKDDIFNIVFCIALISVAIQGMLLSGAAQKLDMVDASQNVLKTFSDYQDEQQLPLIQITLKPGHRFIGRKLSELKMRDMLVVLIKRDGESLIPRGDITLLENDILVLSGESYQEDTQSCLDEMVIEEENDWIGKTIQELPGFENSLIVLIKREDGSTVVPRGNTKIKSGDVLVMSVGK